MLIPDIADLHPKTWLKPFRRTGIFSLTLMGLFYHGLGLALMYVGSFFASRLISNYEIPQFPVSIFLALSSGLLEESVFFGIPYYLSASPFVIFGSGMAWSVSHLFSSGVFSIGTLSYGAFLLTIPHVFFSIRTWASKKGWFAITFHSGWNFTFLILYCMWGLRQCSLLNDSFDVLNIMMATSAGIIVYLAYKNKKTHVNRFLFLIPSGIILLAMTVLFFEDLLLPFS